MYVCVEGVMKLQCKYAIVLSLLRMQTLCSYVGERCGALVSDRVGTT